MSEFQLSLAKAAQTGKTKLFVGNVPSHITQEVLQNTFGTFGQVVELRALKPGRSGQWGALVRFATFPEAERALAMNASECFEPGIALVVRFADNQQQGDYKVLYPHKPHYKQQAPSSPMDSMFVPNILDASQSATTGKEKLPTTGKEKLLAACRTILDLEVQDGLDIVYSSAKTIGNRFQTSITIPCLPGEFGSFPFTGAIKANEGDAEESAAKIALDSIKDDETFNSKLKEQKVEEPPAKRQKAGTEISLSEACNHMGEKKAMNAACMKILKRNLNEEDISYKTTKVQGGFQSEVTISCLADFWGIKTYVGCVMPSNEAAEGAVANIALRSIAEQLGEWLM